MGDPKYFSEIPKDPTQEEIAEECRKIRENWSQNEHYRRTKGIRIDEEDIDCYWRPPEYKTKDLYLNDKDRI